MDSATTQARPSLPSPPHATPQPNTFQSSIPTAGAGGGGGNTPRGSSAEGGGGMGRRVTAPGDVPRTPMGADGRQRWIAENRIARPLQSSPTPSPLLCQLPALGPSPRKSTLGNAGRPVQNDDLYYELRYDIYNSYVKIYIIIHMLCNLRLRRKMLGGQWGMTSSKL